MVVLSHTSVSRILHLGTTFQPEHMVAVVLTLKKQLSITGIPSLSFAHIGLEISPYMDSTSDTKAVFAV